MQALLGRSQTLVEDDGLLTKEWEATLHNPILIMAERILVVRSTVPILIRHWRRREEDRKDKEERPQESSESGLLEGFILSFSRLKEKEKEKEKGVC